jgi:hypothetical protein
LLLTEEALWISDCAQDEKGKRVFGHPTGVLHKNRKARRFECWMTAIQRDGEWTFRRGIEIYDQGGMVWLETEEEAPQQVVIKMRATCAGLMAITGHHWSCMPIVPTKIVLSLMPGQIRPRSALASI